ncbi:MAG: fused MFS/spermidine synthase [Chloroflexi bacterium]|nr:fused MFS/spermidine synthase [Chloroflexota bacterium]
MAAPGKALAPARSWTVSSSTLLRLLLLLFFCSGISGLVYQVLWLRILSLTFGVTVFAVSTVLASFMAGLALGSYLAGRIADRLRNPLLAYGTVEVCIGVAALLVPPLIFGLQGVYKTLYEALGGAPLLVGAVRVVLAFLIMLVPTSLMGATLPIIIKSSLMRAEGLSQNVSLLYAVNTFGAIVGTAMAGFYLVATYGIQTTTNLAATVNIVVGLAAVVAARLLAPTLTEAQEAIRAGDRAVAQSAALIPSRVQRVVFAAFALSGCLSLAYEVVWSRVLAMFFNSSVYAFTVMLTTVLFGIAVGSWAITPLLRRRWNWVLVFGLLELAVALTAALSLLTLGQMYPLTGLLQEVRGVRRLLADDLSFMAVVAFLAIFPPMFLLGMTFPAAARVYAANAADAGRRIGAIYSANTCGAIFGSIAGGFVLIPHLGAQNSLVALALGNAAIGLALLAVAGRPAPLSRLALAVGPAVVLGLLLRLAPNLYPAIFAGREEWLRTRPFVPEDAFCAGQTIWYEESLENTVSVSLTPSDVRCLFTNSRGQTNSDPGLVAYHRTIGHFGLLLHPNPRDMLVVGLGGGATPGAAAQWENVHVDIVELSEGVVHAAPWFREENYDVLNLPNVTLRVDDGRNYLLLTGKRYDVVTADIIRPNDAGAANLYSVEYFRLVRDVLKDDGLMVQWLAPFSEYQYKLLMRTFLAAFPHVTLWSNGDLLVGSKSPIRIDPAVLEAKFRQERAATALEHVGLFNAQQVLDRYNASKPELERVAGDGPIITDNHPYIEYFRSLPRDGPPDVTGYSHNVAEILK